MTQPSFVRPQAHTFAEAVRDHLGRQGVAGMARGKLGISRNYLARPFRDELPFTVNER